VLLVKLQLMIPLHHLEEQPQLIPKVAEDSDGIAAGFIADILYSGCGIAFFGKDLKTRALCKIRS